MHANGEEEKKKKKKKNKKEKKKEKQSLMQKWKRGERGGEKKSTANEALG